MQSNTASTFLYYNGETQRFENDLRNPGDGGVLGANAAHASNEDPGGVGGRQFAGVNNEVHPSHPQSQRSGHGQIHDGLQSGNVQPVGEHADDETVRQAGGGGSIQGNPQTPINSQKKKSRAAIRIASLNMNGGGSRQSEAKWVRINNILRSNSLNILALQETHLTEVATLQLEQRYNRFKIFGSPHPTHPTNRGGVAIIINKHNTKWQSATNRTLIPGRAMVTTLALNDDAKLHILTVYAPSGNDVENATFWTDVSFKGAPGSLGVSLR